MKILVTGRQGQLARSFAERADAQRNIQLIFAGRPDLDLAVPGSAARFIAALQPDIIVNAAAYTAVDQAEDEPALAHCINADAVGEIGKAAAEIGAAVIHISTDYIFDGTLDRRYREDDQPHPLNVYGASKLAGEEQLRSSGSKHLIVRTSWVVSPFGRNFVRTVVEAARTRDMLTVVADQRGKPTSALDLADAILAVIGRWAEGQANGLGRTFHVAGGGEASWNDVACEVMEECRRVGVASAQVKPILTSEWPTRAQRPLNSVLDCSRFDDEFGLSLPDWRASVRHIVGRLAAGAPLTG